MVSIIPPSPALIGFEDWKLNVPTSPIAPTGRPRHADPWACAASSTTLSPCRCAAAMTPSMSTGEPPWWTGMIALVRGVTAASMRVGSMSSVSSSTSTNTGTAPTMSAALAVAMNVYGGTRTSSPGPIPSALRATDSAIVPLTQAIPWRAAWRAANSTSSCLT